MSDTKNEEKRYTLLMGTYRLLGDSDIHLNTTCLKNMLVFNDTYFHLSLNKNDYELPSSLVDTMYRD